MLRIPRSSRSKDPEMVNKMGHGPQVPTDLPNSKATARENWTEKRMSRLHFVRLQVSGLPNFKLAFQRAWRIGLAFSALLDFCATVLPKFFVKERVEAPKRWLRIFPTQSSSSVVGYAIPSTGTEKLFYFLHEWHHVCTFLFAFLWLVNSFFEAGAKRKDALIRRDRNLVMKENVNPRKENNNVTTSTESLGRGWSIFYWFVAIQLALLPVGFYVFLWKNCFYVLFLNRGATSSNYADVEFRVSDSKEPHAPFFVANGSHSLLVEVVRCIAAIIQFVVGERARVHRKWLTVKAVQYAVKKPLRFSKLLRSALKYLRWVKYLAPLIGRVNKLRSNIVDLVRKQRQRVATRHAALYRRHCWNALSRKEKEEIAAIRVQRAFRGMYSRKLFRALQILRGSKMTMIALRMQKSCRASLARARARIEEKKKELAMLQAQAATFEKESRVMTEQDRRRMYQLESELTESAKYLISRKMLLRPNTRFAVTWKYVFVLCVLLEILQLATKPKLESYKTKTSGVKRMSLIDFVESSLTPKATLESDLCLEKLVCQPWYQTAQLIYTKIVHNALHQGAFLVGVICFVDVFVTFFTGELHPETGSLEPKSFYRRWLLPGLLLQLLVNPQMGYVYQLICELSQAVLDLGPVRVFRWTAACFYPLARGLFYVAQHVIWTPFVMVQNEKKVQ